MEKTKDMQHIELDTYAAPVRAQGQLVPRGFLRAGRFVLRFLEMLVAMMVGMPFFFMVRSQVPASSSLRAIFVRGTIPFDLSMVVVMTFPMVIWMIVRGHGRRHSAEMAFAMSGPMVVAIALRLLVGSGTYLPWLRQAGYLGMSLGMLIAMLYRREHYIGQAGYSAHDHSVHAAHQEIH